jgi:protein O-mannosyl-transferase
VFAIALTYGNSLSAPFILDDEATIVQNPQIRDLSRPREVLLPRADSPIAGRPIASLSFAVNYAAGGLNVRGYHLVNIAVHAVCAVLLMTLLAHTFNLPRVRTRLHAAPLDLGFAAALIWAVHPLNSEVVNYLSQRTESLMAVFYLLTMYAAVRAAQAGARTGNESASPKSHSGARGPASPKPHSGEGGRWELTAALACLAGLGCKESIVTAPVVLALYDRIFLFDSWRAAIQRRRRLYAGLGVTWILTGVLLAAGPRAAVAGFSSGVSPWTYLLNQAGMITRYLRLAIWPDSLVVFYGWPVALTAADVAPYLALIAGLLALSCVALWRWPALGFLAAWFFITLAPASSIVPIATEVGAERRMYLPLMALAVLGVVVADFAGKRASGDLVSRTTGAVPSLKSVPLVLTLAASLALAGVTFARNREYASDVTLARTVVERHPTPVAHHILAEQLVLSRGDVDEATRHLRDAVMGGDSRARYLLGQLLVERGQLAEGVAELEAFVKTSQLPYRLVPRWLEPPVTEIVMARYVMGRAFLLQQQPARAAEQAKLMADAVPGHVGAQQLWADALFAQQQWGAAAEHYRHYLGRQPADPVALMNYGVTQVAVENLDAAIAAFTRAVTLDPANARARQLLALAQADRARLAASR